jgi:hypothetical protein
VSVLGRVGVLVASVATLSVVATAYAGDAAKTSGGTEKTQVILGPNSAIDSLYATVRSTHNHLYAFMGNQNVYMYRQHRDGSLSDPREILSRGAPGTFDHCGVHLVGMIYKATPRHWITYYHAERAAPADNGDCNHNDRHTR